MNKVKRARLWGAADKDPSLQNALIYRCKQDPVFWINTFCWTYDPRQDPAKLPFELYPFQEWLVKEWASLIEEQQDFGVEKCRDMGITWLLLLLFQWGWLFKGWDFLIGSRKEEEVDTLGDMATHFPKLRFNFYKLPTWMRPPGFNKKQHDTFMKMIHPTFSNSITGESSNPAYARGGRYRVVLFDEFAFWPWAEPAWASASHSTRCRIALSTPYGKANKFAKLMLDPKNEIRQYAQIPDSPSCPPLEG